MWRSGCDWRKLRVRKLRTLVENSHTVAELAKQPAIWGSTAQKPNVPSRCGQPRTRGKAGGARRGFGARPGGRLAGRPARRQRYSLAF